jgi:hypothetical protein
VTEPNRELEGRFQEPQGFRTSAFCTFALLFSGTTSASAGLVRNKDQEAKLGARTGILTFHRCINYGSFWQAHCLVSGLSAQGHDVEIINHHSHRVDQAEWRCALSPDMPRRSTRRDMHLYRIKARKFFAAIAGLPLSARQPLDGNGRGENYEIVLIGSDEVWNLDHPWYGGTKLFYGEGVNADRLIAYAASFGSQPRTRALDDPRAESLRRFDEISVRDENSRLILFDALGVSAPLVVDPCLLFKDTLHTLGLSCGNRKEYVAVYGQAFPKWFVEVVEAYSRRRGLSTVSIGYRNDWATYSWLDAGPHDYARFIADAACVATSFFHGCIFSIIYDKPFICCSTPYRANKLLGLVEQINAKARLVVEETPGSQVHGLLDQPLGVEFQERVDHLCQHSRAILSHALQ